MADKNLTIKDDLKNIHTHNSNSSKRDIIPFKCAKTVITQVAPCRYSITYVSDDDDDSDIENCSSSNANVRDNEQNQEKPDTEEKENASIAKIVNKTMDSKNKTDNSRLVKDLLMSTLAQRKDLKKMKAILGSHSSAQN